MSNIFKSFCESCHSWHNILWIYVFWKAITRCSSHWFRVGTSSSRCFCEWIKEKLQWMKAEIRHSGTLPSKVLILARPGVHIKSHYSTLTLIRSWKSISSYRKLKLAILNLTHPHDNFITDWTCIRMPQCYGSPNKHTWLHISPDNSTCKYRLLHFWLRQALGV